MKRILGCIIILAAALPGFADTSALGPAGVSSFVAKSGAAAPGFAIIDLGAGISNNDGAKVNNKGQCLLRMSEHWRFWNWGEVRDYSMSGSYPTYRIEDLNNLGQLAGSVTTQTSSTSSFTTTFPHPNNPDDKIEFLNTIQLYYVDPIIIDEDGEEQEIIPPLAYLAAYANTPRYIVTDINDNGDYLLTVYNYTIGPYNLAFPAYPGSSQHIHFLNNVELGEISSEFTAFYEGGSPKPESFRYNGFSLSIRKYAFNNNRTMTGRKDTYVNSSGHTHSDSYRIIRRNDTISKTELFTRAINHNDLLLQSDFLHQSFTLYDANTGSSYSLGPGINGIALSTPEEGQPLLILGDTALYEQKRDPADSTLLPYSRNNFNRYQISTIIAQNSPRIAGSTNPKWSNFQPASMSDNGAFILGRAKNNETNEFHALLLLKVDLEWISKDEANNPIDENPNEGGGKRYYPGKRLPTESDPRNLITLKVSIPGLSGKQVKLKAFDVDDPTKSAFNFNADEIDTNGDAGNDNFPDSLSTPQSGQFVLNSATSTTATVTLDANGEAEIDFQVGMQPGNNYRVVAVLKDFEGNFDQLQVSNPSGDGFVSADDESVSGFTGAGAASPMLTVWRKLHIEQDSMGAIPTSGSEKNFEEGTIAGVSPAEINPGVWGTEVDLGTIYTGDYVTDEFNKGRLEVFGDPVFDSNGMPVHEVTAFDPGFPATLPGDVNDNASVTVMGTLGASAIGKTFKLYDDDERGLPGSHQPLLPRFDLIADAVSQKYAPAYITVIDADSLGLNPNKTVNFEKHNELNNLLPNVANNAEDLSSYADDEDFWTLLVTAVYQGATSEDHDPDTETPALEGALLENLLGASPAFAVIFMEGIREDAWTALNSRNLASVQAGQQSFVNRIADVVAHEIGHAPAGSATGDEHDEGGLMGSGIQGAEFRAESVARFRKAQTWR